MVGGFQLLCGSFTCGWCISTCLYKNYSNSNQWLVDSNSCAGVLLVAGAFQLVCGSLRVQAGAPSFSFPRCFGGVPGVAAHLPCEEVQSPNHQSTPPIKGYLIHASSMGCQTLRWLTNQSANTKILDRNISGDPRPLFFGICAPMNGATDLQSPARRRRDAQSSSWKIVSPAFRERTSPMQSEPTKNE